jgi:membrane associated rhomboid family serine protease
MRSRILGSSVDLTREQKTFCYHHHSMALQRCANCEKEFEGGLGGSAGSDNCPECSQRQAQAIHASQLAGTETTTAISFPVTFALIGLNVLVFAVMVLSGVSAFLPTPKDAIRFGADFGPLTLNGQWWRLVTSMLCTSA